MDHLTARPKHRKRSPGIAPLQHAFASTGIGLGAAVLIYVGLEWPLAAAAGCGLLVAGAVLALGPRRLRRVMRILDRHDADLDWDFEHRRDRDRDRDGARGWDWTGGDGGDGGD